MVIAFITCYFGDLVSDIWLRVIAISVFIHNIRGAPVITLAAVITKGCVLKETFRRQFTRENDKETNLLLVVVSTG